RRQRAPARGGVRRSRNRPALAKHGHLQRAAIASRPGDLAFFAVDPGIYLHVAHYARSALPNCLTVLPCPVRGRGSRAFAASSANSHVDVIAASWKSSPPRRRTEPEKPP